MRVPHRWPGVRSDRGRRADLHPWCERELWRGRLPPAVYRDSPAPAAHLLDTSGQRFARDDVPTTAGPAFPGTVTLDPGGTAEGFITFRLPQDADPAAVQFALDTGLADDVGQWSLPLP
ncbi:hypothetical protein ACWGIU_22065 [Streptomyces sp. NPDC054840]